ncbi:hypothetical protein [Streptococcus uberis]
MLNIFETYDQAAQDLHYSLVMSGFLHPTVILNENGFYLIPLRHLMLFSWEKSKL